MNFVTVFNPPESRGVSFKHVNSKTQQEYLHESLTSTIMERYSRTGVLVPPGSGRREPLFADLSEVPDNVQESYDVLMRARADFDALPSSVRARFNNSPLELYAFLGSERNRDEAISLGLIAKTTKDGDAPTSKSEAKPKDQGDEGAKDPGDEGAVAGASK